MGVDADYNPETGEGTIFHRGSGHSSKNSSPEQLKGSAEKHVLTPVKKPPPKWLSDLDGDAWVGARVRITTGRMKGHEGAVLRSGNGWVQVETPTFGEVAKRAHELELVSYDVSKVSISIPRTGGHTGQVTTAGVKRSHDMIEEGYVRTSSGRQVRPRAPSDADDEYFNRGRANGGRTHSYDSAGNLLTTPAEARPQSAPLIHPNIKEARNQYMQKYVKKMTDKLRHRPDLMYWTHMLKASHVLSGGLPDPALERELARDFMDSVCSSCLKERWPAAKYCWNEACPASPVYYKLTGCPLPAPDAGVEASVNTSSSTAGDGVGARRSVVEGGGAVKAEGQDGVPTITIGEDSCPGDARFNAADHAQAVAARRHAGPPISSAVATAHAALPGVIMPPPPHGAGPHRAKANHGAGVLVVETDKSSYKIPNSSSGRAMLMQKLVREGLTDNSDRVCGDNWSVPSTEEGDCATGGAARTSVSISKVPATLTSVPNGQTPAAFPERKEISPGAGMTPLPALQLSGMARSQSERPPLLPSILPQSSPVSKEFRPSVESGGLLLSAGAASASPGGARISPYLARGPDCFGFSTSATLTPDGPKSPTTRVA